MWHTKYALAAPKNSEVGADFRRSSEGDFRASVVRDLDVHMYHNSSIYISLFYPLLFHGAW